MVDLRLLVGLACAIFFFRAAQYERMSPWLWALSSLGISFIVSLLFASLLWVVLAQIGLFAGMWAYNAQRPARN